jgi:hypothetical protein
MFKQRLAKPAKGVEQWWPGVRIGGNRPEGRHHKPQRPLEEQSSRFGKLGRPKDGAKNRPDLTVMLGEDLCGALNKPRRWGWGDKSMAQLACDMPSGTGMAAGDFNQPVEVAGATTGGNRTPKNQLLAIVVPLCTEEGPILIGGKYSASVKGPATQAAGCLGDILLGVAAINAECVKFEEFTCIVLIWPVIPAGADFVGGIVEIDEHRGRRGRGLYQIGEAAKRMLSDYRTVIGWLEENTVSLSKVNVEVIAPETDE